MDRRLFLAGLVSVAGAATIASVIRPTTAEAGVPNGAGVLDQLDDPIDDLMAPEDDATVQPVWHRDWHRPRRRRRRRRWRRICRRYWRHGRWRTRCRREAVWIYLHF
jgi:hypothetical protein